MNGEYKIVQMNEDTWSIEEDRVRFFLLTGSREALLIDSGYFVTDVKGIAESLTDLPLKLLNTHADLDHIACNSQFELPYMHLSELSNYHNTHGGTGDITPIADGDIIDLGGRDLRIIAMPGHTPGSIAVLDVKHRVLISGDPIQDGSIFMFGPQREIYAYRHSLKRLASMGDIFDQIYPSHGSIPLGKDIIPELILAATKIIDGEAEYTDASYSGRELKCFDADCAKFLLNK